MDTTSPSKKTMRMNNQENGTVREKNCNKGGSCSELCVHSDIGNPAPSVCNRPSLAQRIPDWSAPTWRGGCTPWQAACQQTQRLPFFLLVKGESVNSFLV